MFQKYAIKIFQKTPIWGFHYPTPLPLKNLKFSKKPLFFHQIALIGAVVGPVDLHQMAFPRRRIFVFQLGYFGFGQVADQKPDLADYGPWMADMDIQVKLHTFSNSLSGTTPGKFCEFY